MADSLNDAVFKFFLIVIDWETDRPCWVQSSWPHWVWRIMPSHSAWSVDILRWKLSIEVYRLCLSVVTHWDTPMLQWCAKTETENNKTWFIGPTRVLNPKWHVDRLSRYWRAHCCGRLTDRLNMLSMKELTTQSMKNNSFTLGVVGRYTSMETFHRSIYRLRLSVFTH